jgi:hypothetical protein
MIKIEQTPTSKCVADDKHCRFVGGASPWTTSPHIHAAQDQSHCDDEEKDFTHGALHVRGSG